MAVFPRRLFEILSVEDPRIVSWNEDGKSFHIHNTVEFSNKILPRYFRHCKLTSFQRQLNLYGFQRIHVGPLDGAYHHPSFQRDNFALIASMKRTVRKTGQEEAEEEEEDETSKHQQHQHQQQMMDMNQWQHFVNTSMAQQSSHPEHASSSSSSFLNLANYAASNLAATVSMATAPMSSNNTSREGGVDGGVGMPEVGNGQVMSSSGGSPMEHEGQKISHGATIKGNFIPTQSFRSNGSGGGLEPISSFDSQDWQHTVELLQHSDSERSMVNHNLTGHDYEHDYGERGASYGSSGIGGGGGGYNQRTKESRRLSSSSRPSMERGPQTKRERVQLSLNTSTGGINTQHSFLNDMAPPSPLSPFISAASLTPEMLGKVLKAASRDNLHPEKYSELSEHLVGNLGEKEALCLTLALLAKSLGAALPHLNHSTGGGAGGGAGHHINHPPNQNSHVNNSGYYGTLNGNRVVSTNSETTHDNGGLGGSFDSMINGLVASQPHGDVQPEHATTTTTQSPSHPPGPPPFAARTVTSDKEDGMVRV